jgi:phosphoglycerate dehydrogenase-like enzyme
VIRIAALASPTFAPLAALRSEPDLEVTSGENAAALRHSIGDADVIVLAPRYGEVLRELWPDAKRIRWIHSLGAGVETLPFDLLRPSDVVVTNSRGLYADALGEFAVAAMLWFAKDLRRLVRNQASHIWEPFTVERLEGKTVGIVGYGGIGRAVGRRAEALGMKTATVRRHAGDLDDVIGAADYLVVSTPLTAETRGLISRQRIALMRPASVLINVSRGAVVDEGALIEALRGKRIRGAALDVFETEPLPPDHPLWSLDNVLISPHSADKTSDSHERAMAFFLRNLEAFRGGGSLENVVDKNAGY